MATELRRSASDRVLFGVCGGLADYFKMDSVLVRAGFLILVVISGVGLLAYLVLTLLMPKAGTQTTDARTALRENVESVPQEAGEAARRAGGALRHAVGKAGEGDAVQRRRTLAAALIIGGVVLVLANTISLWWAAWGLVWPAVLIAIGVALLLSAPKGDSTH